MRARSTVSLLVLGLLALTLGALAPRALPRAAADSGKRELTEREWKKLMKGWSRDLGVKCGHCHVPKNEDEFDFEAETPNKQTALRCEEQFVERLTLRGARLSCADCHAGQARFLPRRGAGPQGKLDAGD